MPENVRGATQKESKESGMPLNRVTLLTGYQKATCNNEAPTVSQKHLFDYSLMFYIMFLYESKQLG